MAKAKVKVRKGGVNKTIEANELGIYLNAGYVEVVDKTSPKFEKVIEPEKVEEPKAKKKKA